MLQPFSPFVLDGVVGDSAVKVKVNSGANANMYTNITRHALGWSKRTRPIAAFGNGGVKKPAMTSTDQRDNSRGGSGRVMMTCVLFFLLLLSCIRVIDLRNSRPGDNLRPNRPRPKGQGAHDTWRAVGCFAIFVFDSLPLQNTKC